MLSPKGSSSGSHQRLRVEEEIEKKWAELERLPVKDMSSLPQVAPLSSSQSANEALQREVVRGVDFPICRFTKMQMKSSSVWRKTSFQILLF